MRLLTKVFLASIAAIPIAAFGCATEEIPPYGDPAKVVGGAGATGSTGGPGCTPDAGCAVSFQNDVFPILQDTAKCADAMCHGGNAGDLTLTAGDPKKLREELVALTLKTTGKPYIACDVPGDSQMLCNMRIETGLTNSYGKCGSLMPKVDPDDTVADARLTQAQLDTIAEWIQCGVPDN